MSEVRDEFGHRFFEGRTLPARDMGLVARHLDEMASQTQEDFVLQHEACSALLERVLAGS